MSNHLAKLGPDGDRLKVLFVTVDPERDTPDQLRLYLASFDPRVIGLTGTPEQIAAVAKSWNAFLFPSTTVAGRARGSRRGTTRLHNKIPEDDGTYTVVHSAYVYLMDATNHCVGTMGFQDPEAEQLQKMRKLLLRTGERGK
jgi:protein SCO1/2